MLSVWIVEFRGRRMHIHMHHVCTYVYCVYSNINVHITYTHTNICIRLVILLSNARGMSVRNIVSFIGLLCKRDLEFEGAY